MPVRSKALLDRGKKIVSMLCPDAEIEMTYTYRTHKHGRNEVAAVFRFPSGAQATWTDESPEDIAMDRQDYPNWDFYARTGKTLH